MPKGSGPLEKGLNAGLGNAPAAASAAAVTAALAGMAGAWIAAGSTGLLAHPLRHALTWLALAVALAAAWRGSLPGLRPGSQPGSQPGSRSLTVLAAVVALAMTIPNGAVCNVLAVTLVLAMLARAMTGVDRQLLLVTSFATAVLGVYRLGCTSIPTVWSIADTAGGALGQAVEVILDKPLRVGATFGGLDFLVLMAALVAGWVIQTRRPRVWRAVGVLGAVLGGHLIYLTVLAYATDLAAALPEPPFRPDVDPYVPPEWSWSEGVATLLPWNLPLLAGAIQLVIAAMIFRWSAWSTDDKSAANEPAGWAPVVLAAVAGVLTTLAPNTSSLVDKRIVAYEAGYVDWEKPVHDSFGQFSSGMCGMLPTFVASLGGTFVRSADLSADDLAGADVLILIHPVEPWPEERVERVWDFVRGGGSLLVAAGTRVHEAGFVSAFDGLLRPTSIEVRFDTAIPQIDQWQHTQQVAAHPATAGIGDRRNRFGTAVGSSIDARWPASPLVVGRWGWSDPGSDAVMTEVFRFEPGEKLGDLVLAAEQTVGEGKVVVLGEATSLTNQGNPGCYPFTGRLLSYLASRPSSPQAPWRQAAGLAVLLALVGLLARRPSATQLAAVAAVLGLSTVAAGAIGHFQSPVLPDGRRIAPETRVACIDGSHLEAYSNLGWVEEGIAGLELTLMRNGYLPLVLPELTGARLQGAELLISIAPARRFSEAERRAVGDFVEGGGIFVCTAGAERAEAANGLLRDFGFRVPRSPVRPLEEGRPPTPMGHFFSQPYLQTEDYENHVLFYAGWPIEPPNGVADVRVRGFDHLPVIAIEHVGRGKVVVVGDAAFVLNKNLENLEGEPLSGDYDNAHFWRWLIAHLTDRPAWLPPEPVSESAEEAGAAEEGPAAGEEDEPRAEEGPAIDPQEAADEEVGP